MHKSLARKKNMNEEKHYEGWKKEVCKNPPSPQGDFIPGPSIL
jgi:hypothetical protein